MGRGPAHIKVDGPSVRERSVGCIDNQLYRGPCFDKIPAEAGVLDFKPSWSSGYRWRSRTLRPVAPRRWRGPPPAHDRVQLWAGRTAHAKRMLCATQGTPRDLNEHIHADNSLVTLSNPAYQRKSNW